MDKGLCKINAWDVFKKEIRRRFYSDFCKRMGRTSNIVDQKSRYRSHREGIVLVRIKYLVY